MQQTEVPAVPPAQGIVSQKQQQYLFFALIDVAFLGWASHLGTHSQALARVQDAFKEHSNRPGERWTVTCRLRTGAKRENAATRPIKTINYWHCSVIVAGF